MGKAKPTIVKWKQDTRSGRKKTFTQKFKTKGDAENHVKKLRKGAKQLKKSFELIEVRDK